MTEHHKRQLERHRATLVQNMNPREVIVDLRSQGILTDSDAQNINCAGGMNAQNEVLLDLLLRKPDQAFEDFRDALMMSKQRHLARQLKN